MSSTRDFTSPGIFAADSNTTIPPTPIAGVSYRDAVNGTDLVADGWPYGTRVESQDWNQIMFLVTSIITMVDKKGVLGWSSGVDYDGPALTFGSDGIVYYWQNPSGPTLGGAKDPVSEPIYWIPLASAAAITGEIRTLAFNAVPPGYLKCNGQAISRTLFAPLFSVIGTTYGVGDGSTTFNVPDYRGEFLRGLDEGRGVNPGRTLGSPEADMFESHDHGVEAMATTDIGSGALVGGTPDAPDGGVQSQATGGTETRPRNVSVIWVIKY